MGGVAAGRRPHDQEVLHSDAGTVAHKVVLQGRGSGSPVRIRRIHADYYVRLALEGGRRAAWGGGGGNGLVEAVAWGLVHGYRVVLVVVVV